jgi:hypothetical protein
MARMTRHGLAAVALLLGGCPSREAPAPAPTPAVVSVPAASIGPAPSTLPSADPTPPNARRENDPSKWKPGETIIARGRVSNLHAQRVMTSVPGKKEAEFQLAGSHTPAAIYWRQAPSCSGDIEITGKVLEVKASPGGKAGDDYRDLQLDVTSARCVEGGSASPGGW